jgi:hypothetical protein
MRVLAAAMVTFPINSITLPIPIVRPKTLWFFRARTKAFNADWQKFSFVSAI